jgi:ureidoglycolate dehydrogenase (NAD+)
MYQVDSEAILTWGKQLFQKVGLPEADASAIVEALVTTSLWGIDSHGIARIPHYMSRYETGSIKTHPAITFTQTAAATGRVDGDHGHGILIMRSATRHAIQLAENAGVGVVGIYNSSHCGAIGLYTRQITEAGMVGIAFTHSDALVVPHGGKKAFFGTNPISIAFPSEDTSEPVCLDMATSIIPWNFIMNAKREESAVPLGFGVDSGGMDTTNAADIVAVKPMAGHKGYAMAFLIDMLCGPLNGMKFGPNLTAMYQDLDVRRELGSLVIALDPERFGGTAFLKAASSAMVSQVKTQGKDVLFPGQPEYASKVKRLAEGIPVTAALAAEFASWSEKLGAPTLYTRTHG